MAPFVSRVRTPVRRGSAEHYILITLLSFAATVTLVRLVLTLTGYPQVGGGGLHLAHLLWGGLLLFGAALLPLIYANLWIHRTSAVLAGAGAGLFIDEVGKFITANNDYFFPAAAPIVYAFFLLIVLLYTRVRRPPSKDPRSEMYRLFDDLQEVLDHDLSPEERAQMVARARGVAAQEESPQLARLARGLEEFLSADTIDLVPHRPDRWDRLTARIERDTERLLRPPRLRILLILGLFILGAQALVDPIVSWAHLRLPDPLARWLPRLIDAGGTTAAARRTGQDIRIALEAGLGLLLVAGAAFLAGNRRRPGIACAYYGLLLSITTIDLLVFYYDQFSTIALALVQFLLLIVALRLRRSRA